MVQDVGYAQSVTSEALRSFVFNEVVPSSTGIAAVVKGFKVVPILASLPLVCPPISPYLMLVTPLGSCLTSTLAPLHPRRYPNRLRPPLTSQVAVTRSAAVAVPKATYSSIFCIGGTGQVFVDIAERISATFNATVSDSPTTALLFSLP